MCSRVKIAQLTNKTDMSQPPPFRSPLSSPDPTTSSTSQFSPPRNIHLGSPTTPTYPLSRTASPTPLLPPSQPQSHSQSLSISTAPSTFSGTSHSGCVLCGLVATAARQSGAADADGDVAGPSRGTSSGRREVVYHDADITIYPAVGKERLCEGGKHLVVVVNRHLESVYDFVRFSLLHFRPHLPLLAGSRFENERKLTWS